MWKKPAKAQLSDMDFPPMGQDLGLISGQATLGPSITIHGELSGSEDLTIQGVVEGEVHLKGHCLTVGQKGHVQANIYANDIKIDGVVDGDLVAEQQVCIRKGGRVNGNISAKRVVLEDGCQFKGRIDMDVVSSNQTAAEEIIGEEPDEDLSVDNISALGIENDDLKELKSGNECTQG